MRLTKELVPLCKMLCWWGSLLYAATASAAEPTHDQLLRIDAPLELHFAHLGRAVLANVQITDTAAAQKMLQPMLQQSIAVENIEPDRYGRMQIVIYAPGSTVSMQQQMLRVGIATFYPTVKSRKASLDWSAEEAQAQAAHRGYWSTPEHTLTPQAATEAMGKPAVIEGALTNIYQARSAYYINFGVRWQDDFSIKIPRKYWRSLQPVMTRIEASLAPPDQGDERRRQADPAHPVWLRVRGGVINENGAMVVVTRPEQLEIIAHADPR